MSKKYSDARYPEKINDLMDNDGKLNPEINNLEVLAFIEGNTLCHFKKKENGF